jgi:hypothetical protein
MNQANFIEKVAEKISNLGLTAPAILLLEANKPLAFIGSQLLLVAQPTLDLFLPRDLTKKFTNLLEDPAQFEQLIVSLETKASWPQYSVTTGSKRGQPTNPKSGET